MILEHPLVLAALPLLALWIGWLERRLPGRTSRRWARFLVRMAILALVLAAVGGAHETGSVPKERRLVIAVDRAARLSPDAVAEADRFAGAARKAAARHDIAVTQIAFTTRAAGGLAEAQLALGADETGGVLLITDGRGRLDGVADAARALRSDGYAVTAAVVPEKAPPAHAQAAIAAVDAPESVRGPFTVRAAADLPDGRAGRLTLHVDGTPGQSLDVGASHGTEVRFDELELEPGLHELSVVLHTDGDEPGGAGAHVRCIVEVGAPPRVTTLLADAGSSPWRAALRGQGLRVSDAAPDTLTNVLAQVAALPDVVVADAASLGALPPATALMLAEQVRGGMGLLVEPGSAEKAWAALANGPFADLLPVRPLPEPEPEPPPPPPPSEAEPEPEVDPPEPEKGPGLKAERRPEEALPISLLLVVDRSPSMEGVKFEMALEGARRAAMALSPWDRVGVITFATEARLNVPFRSARSAASLPIWLSTVQTGGHSTNIFGALKLASQTLAKEKSPILHLLLLTDGYQTPTGPIFGPVVKPMRRRGITITAIGLGAGANMRELREIVQWAASGMVVPVADASQLPTILTEDTERITKKRKAEAEKIDARLRDKEQPPETREPEVDEPPPPPVPAPDPGVPATPEPATPEPDVTPDAEPLPLRIVRKHEALAGLDAAALPRVGAPRRTETVYGAPVLIERADGAPVLAATRAGLGRVLVWTLPPKDAGALAWPDLGRLFAQTARAVMAPRGALGYLPAARVTQGPDGAFLRVDWPAGTSTGRLKVRWHGPGGPEDLGVFTPEDAAAGRPLPDAPPGTLCRLELTLPEGPTMPPVSYAVAAAPVRAPQAGDTQALVRVLEGPLTPPTHFVAALPTGSLPARLPRWPWLLWIAVALLPLDVWLHRRSRTA